MTRRGEPAWDSWANVYDLADGDRTGYVDFYTGLVTSRTSSVLDLGCGTGTITIPLAEKAAGGKPKPAGVRVVGIDESPKMLAIAEARAKRSAAASDRIEWLLGDMRTLPLDGPFDLVTCGYISFQYLIAEADFRRALREVRRVVAEDGTFAFDLYQPNMAYLAAGHENRLARVVAGEGGEVLEIRETASFDAGSRVLSVDWQLVRPASPGLQPVAVLHQAIRQYFPEEVGRLVAASGFSIAARFGDVDGSSFTPQSRKQVYVCKPSTLL